MKTHIHLALALAAAPLCPGMATEATPPQIPPTVQQLIALEAEELAQLRSVRDKATADAACARLRELGPLMDPLKRTWEVEKANREGLRREDKTARERKAETERLLWEGFYGSATLAKLLTGEPLHAAPLQPYPAELLQQAAEKSLAIRDAHRSNDIRDSSGGPGYTRETAWVLPAEDQKYPVAMSAIGFLSEIASDAPLRYPDNARTRKTYIRKLFADGKAYWCAAHDSTVATPAPARYRLEQWFDVSALTPYRCEADVEADLAALVSTMSKLTQTMQGVKDTATADAAAPQLAAMINKIKGSTESLRNWFNRTEIVYRVNAHGFDYPELKNAYYSLKEQNFYNSTTLKNAIWENSEQKASPPPLSRWLQL